MAVDIVPLDLLGLELDKAVVQEQGGAGTDDLGEPGKTYRNPAGIALDFLARQDEMIARLRSCPPAATSPSLPGNRTPGLWCRRSLSYSVEGSWGSS